jgi:hypothetical protein
MSQQPVGEHYMGKRARDQLRVARHDPRLARTGTQAMIADFWDALEEAERIRTLSVLGLHELAQAHDRDYGAESPRASSGGPSKAEQKSWERSAWAQAELETGFPHINAQALISMNSALDAMVEELVDFWRPRLAELLVTRLYDSIQATADAAGKPSPHTRDEIAELVRKKQPKRSRLRGSGVGRYEPLLAQIGFAAPADRPIPRDLDVALTELGALRDVLVHRAGRVDARALKQAPTLNLALGAFVRVGSDDFRRYSAALRCYAQEIGFRGIRNWPEVSDEEHGPVLAEWRDHYVIGA